MPKIPIITARKLIKVLKKKGFVYDRTRGSHQVYIRLRDRLSISIPVHQGRDLGRGITLSILQDAKISPKEFFKLL
ncbi:type II toxin-antitoxin system HicA family toxin [Candidatus Microgenomates bacterium]|nr:type II toxin-antitoxin system HicA family toxin [Candidatus Microgenomates bacterium]